MTVEPEITVYRERAHLLRVLAQLFGGVISYNDARNPEWAVLYIESPEGQMSWHIAPGDMDLFSHLRVVQDYPWDGHSTRVKYERLTRVLKRFPKLTYANPVYGKP